MRHRGRGLGTRHWDPARPSENELYGAAGDETQEGG